MPLSIGRDILNRFWFLGFISIQIFGAGKVGRNHLKELIIWPPLKVPSWAPLAIGTTLIPSTVVAETAATETAPRRGEAKDYEPSHMFAGAEGPKKE